MHGDVHARLQRTAQQLWGAAAALEDMSTLPPAVLLRTTIEAAADACAEASAAWAHDPLSAVRHVYAAQLLLRTNERAFRETAAVLDVRSPAEIGHAYAASREVVEELFQAIA